RELLCGLLWPDVPDTQARASLRQALGHIRKAVSPDLLQTSADQLFVNPGVLWVDVATVEKILLRPALDRFEATELYRAELLAGFPEITDAFERWLQNERTRSTERIAARLDECLAALAAHGQTERALRVGEALLSLEPTRETTHRALMRLHWQSDDRPAALRQYEQCREALRRTLALAPSSETEGLRHSILSPSPAPNEGRLVGAAEPEPEPSAQPAPLSQAPSLLERAGRLPLAVLPFTAVGTAADAEQAELFAQLLREDVTTGLSRFRGLAVIARETLSSLGERTRDPARIARATGARVVLSGSVLVAGERVRVTAALVDTTTLLELWSERWEHTRAEFL
ncbi:MAG TPA: BTAD domain-containing putative transcriptional regulator, partial [Polyangiales bacterium]|nr:BTAD domain-containing putative transcriptional regulator [Polyangiales bacterium]